MKNPPFTYTNEIVDYISRISSLLGQAKTTGLEVPGPTLRKSNKIKTVAATLAIEGNTLSEEQITAILEGKKVAGGPKEILEVENAIALYERLDQFDYTDVGDFLRAHGVLMKDLVDRPGHFRDSNVGVLKSGKVTHAAPQAKCVPRLISQHFDWLKKAEDVHAIIRSCVCHYELEFIHPFMDGNGRMGRFWQSLILGKYNPIFRHLPVESVVKTKQSAYYHALERSDQLGESTPFIALSLSTILSALDELIKNAPATANPRQYRRDVAKAKFRTTEFSRKEYLQAVGSISSATASRDLAAWCESGDLVRKGSHNQTTYYFPPSGRD